MKIMKKLSIIAITFALFVTTATSQTAWSPEMQVKVKAIGTPRVSPDAKWVVYTVSNEVMAADKSEYVSQIWLASTDGKESMRLTFADKSSTNPKWSPDGKWIAFTSTRKDNKSNLYVMRVGGGEAEMITDVKTGVGDFEWSPDGKWFAYAMADAKSDDEDKNDKARNDFRWVDENIKMSRLYVMPVAKDANGKRDQRQLTTENRSVTGFDWSPDGSKIVFSHVSDPRADYWPTSDVAIVDVASAKVTPFAATKAAETSPTYSPDGKWIAMTVSDLPVRWAQSGNIVLTPASGGSGKVMPLSHDGQPNIVGWNADSSKLYFVEAKGTGTAMYSVDVAAGTVKESQYANGVVTGVNINGSSTAFGMVMQTSTNPPEAFVARFTDTEPTQVSWANAEAAKMPVGKTELVKWKSKDGREIEGLLTYPNNYVAGSKVPLILNIHGGPAGVFQQSYICGRGVYPLATFASKGYAILRPNPRGSSGYGTEFRRANMRDWVEWITRT